MQKAFFRQKIENLAPPPGKFCSYATVFTPLCSVLKSFSLFFVNFWYVLHHYWVIVAPPFALHPRRLSSLPNDSTGTACYPSSTLCRGVGRILRKGGGWWKARNANAVMVRGLGAVRGHERAVEAHENMFLEGLFQLPFSFDSSFLFFLSLLRSPLSLFSFFFGGGGGLQPP